MQIRCDKIKKTIYTDEQKEEMIQNCYDLIMNDTRFVLDNLDHMPVFQANNRNIKRKPKSL